MKGTGVFRREDMGTVKVSFDFSYGKLVVNLLSAHDVAGKKSQDTYANVFLIDEKRDEEHRIIYRWDEKQRVICEYGHQKTQTKNKNLNPVFQEKFVFQTDTNILKDITKKSLVISIWDEDSTSRDDFMAGITVPLKNVDRFKKLNTEVEIQLHVQEMDGYVSLFSKANLARSKVLFLQPKRLNDSEVEMLFGPLRPLNPPIHDGWDLKECNNRLVTYIDRARVLRQAYELKKSLSEVQLTDRTSVVVTEKNNVIFEQMNKIKSLRADAARRRIEVEQRRKAAKDEAEQNERRYKTQVEFSILTSDWSDMYTFQMTVLRERMAALDALAEEEAKLRCRECSGSSLREYYRGGLSVSHPSNM